MLMITNNNNKHILSIMDVFTFIKLYFCKSTKVKQIIQCLNTYSLKIEKPQNCSLDNATYFRNEKFRTFVNNHKINLKFISVYHHEANFAKNYIYTRGYEISYNLVKGNRKIFNCIDWIVT